jgi:hypothetical protein
MRQLQFGPHFLGVTHRKSTTFRIPFRGLVHLDGISSVCDYRDMPDRSSNQKRPRDANQLAKSIVDLATGDTPPPAVEDKNPAAVALGRLGGLKGGKARAKKLSAAKRKAIAKKAAAARWKSRSRS